eukprot:CAMPEP_0116540698 /NCGR_PEP_ID=MMETSP0397-20121206/89_1 /TAXON_ID=216820 /ORGANISM="Cyclophora tenuis, Strain ECT3854" /LENGTH=166 /DNA_ID=CAMNT_0004064593 /DNA_START=374 /DNA_END=871 /DNA_ORIENTATION=-
MSDGIRDYRAVFPDFHVVRLEEAKNQSGGLLGEFFCHHVLMATMACHVITENSSLYETMSSNLRVSDYQLVAEGAVAKGILNGPMSHARQYVPMIQDWWESDQREQQETLPRVCVDKEVLTVINNLTIEFAILHSESRKQIKRQMEDNPTIFCMVGVEKVLNSSIW